MEPSSLAAGNFPKWKSYESCFFSHQSWASSIESYERANDCERAARLVHIDAGLGVFSRDKLGNGEEQECQEEEEENANDSPVGPQRSDKEQQGQEAPKNEINS